VRRLRLVPNDQLADHETADSGPADAQLPDRKRADRHGAHCESAESERAERDRRDRGAPQREGFSIVGHGAISIRHGAIQVALGLRTLGSTMDAQRYAVVDVETTGFSPAIDRVVEIACLVVDADCRPLDEFVSIVNPGRLIPAFASSIHGIYDEDVAGAPRLDDLAGGLRALTEGAVVVAHNAAFDRGFLPFLHDREWLCTMRLAMQHFPNSPRHTNQALRTYLRVEDPRLAGRDAHRAYADAVVTAGILRHCLQRRNAARHIPRTRKAS
jgi:DNA polymerase-3 subunit epsilon